MSDPATLLPANATEQEKTMEVVYSARVRDITVPLRSLYDPVGIQTDLLPWLAWTLNALEWHSDLSISQQRDAISLSIEIHNKLGTPWALKRGLDLIGLTGAEIIELPVVLYNSAHDFDGAINYSEGPYLFDIKLANAEQGYQVNDIKRAIAVFSNARSHLRFLFVSQIFYDGNISFDGLDDFDGGFISV